MRLLYIKFEPKFNGETVREIWVNFKIKFKYNIGLYTITNSLTQTDKDLMNNRIYTAQNRKLEHELPGPDSNRTDNLGAHRQVDNLIPIRSHSCIKRFHVALNG